MQDFIELKKQLSSKEIIKILHSIDPNIKITDSGNGNLILDTICHNPLHEAKSHKLYYYQNTQLFRCYTGCDESTFDILDLIVKIFRNNYTNLFTLFDAVNYIVNHSTVAQAWNNFQMVERIHDLEFLNKLKKQNNNILDLELPEYNPHILEIFNYNKDIPWISEGISPELLRIFLIGYYGYHNKITIPHHDWRGRLIGVRGRSLNQDDLDNGRKYMPLMIQQQILSHPISFNLYGIWQNFSNVQKYKTLILFEGEKSVLKYGTLFGQDNNITMAVCGNRISTYQRDFIIKYIKPRQVIIAFDKDSNAAQLQNGESYQQLLKKAQKINAFVNTYILFDFLNLLDPKDSPIDKGPDIFLKLMENKVLV